MKHRSTANAAQKRGASSALMVLTALFFVAGLSRLGLGVAEVLAAESANTPANAPAPEGTAQADPGDLFQSLRAREARLQQMEERQEQRAQDLRQAEADIRAQLAELAQAEERLLQTIALYAPSLSHWFFRGEWVDRLWVGAFLSTSGSPGRAHL